MCDETCEAVLSGEFSVCHVVCLLCVYSVLNLSLNLNLCPYLAL